MSEGPGRLLGDRRFRKAGCERANGERGGGLQHQAAADRFSGHRQSSHFDCNSPVSYLICDGCQAPGGPEIRWRVRMNKVGGRVPMAKKPKHTIARDAEETRRRILAAAKVEFARKGLGGARVDEIAARSKSNKRMIYHYFGSKEKLFTAVLEMAYSDIRMAERKLKLDELAP